MPQCWDVLQCQAPVLAATITRGLVQGGPCAPGPGCTAVSGPLYSQPHPQPSVLQPAVGPPCHPPLPQVCMHDPAERICMQHLTAVPHLLGQHTLGAVCYKDRGERLVCPCDRDGEAGSTASSQNSKSNDSFGYLPISVGFKRLITYAQARRSVNGCG